VDEFWESEITIFDLVSDSVISAPSFEVKSPPAPRNSANSYIKGKVRILSPRPLSDDEARALILDLLQEYLALNQFHVHPVELGTPILLNEKEVRTSGQHRAGVASFSTSHYSDAPLRDPGATPQLWETIQALRFKGPERLRLCLRWLVRAVKSTDNVDKFICTWITFEMLYRFLTGVLSTMAGIRGLTGRGIPSRVEMQNLVADNDPAIKALSKLVLPDRGGLDRAAELRYELTSGTNPVQILEKTFSAMSIIRNRLFHALPSLGPNETALCTRILVDFDSKVIKHQLARL